MSKDKKGKKKKKKYLTHTGIISSQYRIKNDRDMNPEDAKEFRETYNKQMKKLANNKDALKDVYTKMAQQQKEQKKNESNSGGDKNVN